MTIGDEMTIKVSISNDEAPGGRSINVEAFYYEKGKPNERRDLLRQLGPGERATFYAWLLKDLHISEVEPR